MQEITRSDNRHVFAQGARDGIPIGLGYFAVAFSLGISAKTAGLDPLQAFIASLLTIASAGEYAAFTLIAASASYLEMAAVIFITNCRYILMSCAMSQRLDPATSTGHRVGMGAFITDEIFGASISREGYLVPAYTYGLASTSVLPWALGTMFGVIAGNILPSSVVTALSVSIFGMFIAIIVPPSKKDPIVLFTVLISFLLSWLSGKLPLLSSVSEGTRIMILTVIIASAAAALFPVKEVADEE
ncbi:MAG: AzlC family ABC transporter permease [Oscillospiraceae bacterium]|nr:AzlC family ABC transporter permease [Oscillospiraceae bacterium]